MARRKSEKKDEKKPEVEVTGVATKQLRRIVLETDGNQVNIAEADVSGIIELKAVLLTVVQAIDAGVVK